MLFSWVFKDITSVCQGSWAQRLFSVDVNGDCLQNLCWSDDTWLSTQRCATIEYHGGGARACRSVLCRTALAFQRFNKCKWAEVRKAEQEVRDVMDSLATLSGPSTISDSAFLTEMANALFPRRAHGLEHRRTTTAALASAMPSDAATAPAPPAPCTHLVKAAAGAPTQTDDPDLLRPTTTVTAGSVRLYPFGDESMSTTTTAIASSWWAEDQQHQ